MLNRNVVGSFENSIPNFGRVLNARVYWSNDADEYPLIRFYITLDDFQNPQAIWLASERNTYVTGHVLTVDGGLTVTF